MAQCIAYSAQHAWPFFSGTEAAAVAKAETDKLHVTFCPLHIGTGAGTFALNGQADPDMLHPASGEVVQDDRGDLPSLPNPWPIADEKALDR